MYKIFFENETELQEAEFYDNFDFSNFCISENDRILNGLRLNQINFERKKFENQLKKILLNIKTTIYLSKNSNNANIKTINRALDTLRNNIDLHFRADYSEIINWHKPSPMNNFLNQFSVEKQNEFFSKELFKKDNIEGSQDYFNKQRLNEVFCDFNGYKIFFAFISLFKKNNKYDLSFSDASFLYRKLFERKYIIESVTHNDFKIRVYNKIDLDFDLKLKVLSKCTTIHKEIIFDLIEKQNRSQKVQI